MKTSEKYLRKLMERYAYDKAYTLKFFEKEITIYGHIRQTEGELDMANRSHSSTAYERLTKELKEVEEKIEDGSYCPF